MPDYCFYTQGKQTVALARSDLHRAADLLAQGYKKEGEEVDAADEKQALVRFRDIRNENAIDRHNFLAGAGTMPLIGVLTAIAAFLFWRRK
ncbi:hypothetical protein [Pantoea sp. GD03673]|uniref:hypothetical protein n=1 Tax=Pantoea sp. GD03673 TaxID=2975364 RepID=UPI002448DA37|nr:hypothetical protein [Pantoea sp. GD03673]MDH2066327.1 hypothetical protein [Pantoea sp. GD03673]